MVRKDTKVCPVCGRRFRVKSNEYSKKYCSRECYVVRKNRRQQRFRSLGTIHDLSYENILKEIYYIRNNIDKGYTHFNSGKSVRDVCLDNSVYYLNDNGEYVDLGRF